MRYGLAIGLILLAVAGRLIPHPDNFTPIMAVALFAGATLTPRIAYIVPLAALVASDLLLGFPLDSMTLVVYGCLFASVGIGQWLATRRTWSRTGLAAIAGGLFGLGIATVVYLEQLVTRIGALTRRICIACAIARSDRAPAVSG